LSRPDENRPNSFDSWLDAEFAETGSFTALVVLVAIGELSITPLRSTWFHVIGPDTRWTHVRKMMDESGARWNGALFAPRTDDDGGPLPDPIARIELRDLADAVIADRSRLNAEHFFDRKGRRMRVEEVPVQ